MTINKKYKDNLFRIIFSQPKDLLALYNAINNTDYTDESLLQITTLKDAVYIGIKNDISFIISNSLNLYEHQSTRNPNMPVRGLLYFARLYQQYIKKNRFNLYGAKLIPLPTPRYIVFCNYEDMEEERTLLHLSDSFDKKDSPYYGLECTAELINVNAGHNKTIMEKCQTLCEYAQFVSFMRKEIKSCTSPDQIEDAIDMVIKYCITHNILKEVLTANYNEVKNVLLEEFDMEEYLQLAKQDARKDGLEEGREEGRKQGLEEGRKQGLEEGLQEGLQKGREETLTHINALYQCLLNDNRLNDLSRAVSDKNFLETLLDEYGIK